MSTFYSQVDWNIEIKVSGEAKHLLKVKLFNLSNRIPTAQDYLEIIFPEEVPLRNFNTKVEDTAFPQGYGYDQRRNAYRLRFDDIPDEIAKQPEINVEISFEQGNIIKKMFDIQSIDVNFTERLYASSIVLIFKLPILSRLKKLLLLFITKLRRRKHLYEINPIPRSVYLPNQIDLSDGLVIYRLRKIIPNFGFIYRFTGHVDVVSLILGWISGIITGIIVELIVNWLVSLIS